MSSPLKKKKKPEIPVAFSNKNDRMILANRDRKNRDLDRYTEQTFHNLKVMCLVCLHDKYSFANKRICRMSDALNRYLIDYADGKAVAPRELAVSLKEKCELDVMHETKKLSSRESLMISELGIPQNKMIMVDLIKVTQYTYFNCVSTFCALLKIEFGFSAKQIREFANWMKYYVEVVTERYASAADLASILSCECKYIEPTFEGLLHEI